jgi:hypothetical protein
MRDATNRSIRERRKAGGRPREQQGRHGPYLVGAVREPPTAIAPRCPKGTLAGEREGGGLQPKGATGWVDFPLPIQKM